MGTLVGSGEAQHDQARHGMIAFVRGPFSRGTLYFAHADGSEVRSQKTHAAGFPAWSPDGSKLAFYIEGSRTRLYVVRGDGGGRRPITRAGGYACYWLSWSPSGRRIAYTFNYDCGGFMSVRVVGVDGTGDTRLVPGEGVFDPVWSPDGKSVLYSGYVKGQTRLFVVGAGGGRGHAIAGTRVFQSNGLPMRPAAAWSRDHIYFLGADSSLWRVDRKGGERRNLTPTLVVQSFELSPDGHQIVLSGVKTEGTRDIYRLRTDGKKLQKLTNGPGAFNGDPRWSPDGRLLAFTHREHYGAQADILIMRADGRDKKRLTHSPLDETAPAWQPNG